MRSQWPLPPGMPPDLWTVEATTKHVEVTTKQWDTDGRPPLDAHTITIDHNGTHIHTPPVP
ncbi:hypothetical protein [Actinomadura sp. 6N118]|uniref:hypothetical protein n=1 Tax=Actinomadura sp. 6N118 TaxID=3375151 RepID=UPI0037932DFD